MPFIEEIFFTKINTCNWYSREEYATWDALDSLNCALCYTNVRITDDMHTFSHYFIPIKIPSICFEQIIVHYLEVIFAHAAYSILSYIYGCLATNTVLATR